MSDARSPLTPFNDFPGRRREVHRAVTRDQVLDAISIAILDGRRSAPVGAVRRINKAADAVMQLLAGESTANAEDTRHPAIPQEGSNACVCGELTVDDMVHRTDGDAQQRPDRSQDAEAIIGKAEPRSMPRATQDSPERVLLDVVTRRMATADFRGTDTDHSWCDNPGGCFTLPVPPGTRVRVVAVPTDQEPEDG